MTELVNLEEDILDREENDYEEDEQYEKAKLIYDPEKINIVTREPTIEQLLRRINKEELDLIKTRKEDIINKFICYVDSDRDFFKSISQAAEKVQYRFSTIEKIIQEVLS